MRAGNFFLGAIIISLTGYFVLRLAYGPQTPLLVDSSQKRGAITNAERYCRDADAAAIMSRQFVKQRLKAPSSAKFPSYQARSTGECEFLAIGEVDAQNGFGAMMRSRYSARMTYHPDTNMWSAKDVVIE